MSPGTIVEGDWVFVMGFTVLSKAVYRTNSGKFVRSFTKKQSFAKGTWLQVQSLEILKDGDVLLYLRQTSECSPCSDAR